MNVKYIFSSPAGAFQINGSSNWMMRGWESKDADGEYAEQESSSSVGSAKKR